MSSDIINLDRPNLLTYQSNMTPEFMDIQATQESPIPDSSCCHTSTTGTTLAYQKTTPKRALVHSSWWVVGCELLGVIDYKTEVYSTGSDRNEQRSSESQVATSQQTRVKVRPPSWITRKAWEAYRRQISGEWKFTFRAYNIVDEHSPILRCIRANDIAGIQDLFARKEATPYDKTMNGCLLLIYYILEEKTLPHSISADLIVFLIDQISSIENMSVAFVMVLSLMILGHRLNSSDYTAVSQHMGALICASNLVDYSDSFLETGPYFVGATNQFLTASTYLLPEYNNYTEVERTQSILNTYLYHSFSPYFIWAALRPKHGVLESEVAQITGSRSGKNLLHTCASFLAIKDYLVYENDLSVTRLAMITSNFYIPQWTYIPEDDTSLLVRLLIESGADMHAINYSGRTPMLETIWSRIENTMLYNGHPRRLLTDSAKPLKTWLRALKLAGVDLQKYGEIEKSLFTAGEVNQDIGLWERLYEDEYGKYPTWRLINFTYGPNVDDWRIWMSESTDQFAGEFWEMVDHPEWNMPGAWPM